MNRLRVSALTLGLAMAVALALTACSGLTSAKPNPARAYPFIHKDFDLRYAWRTSQSDRGVRVEGLLKNVRYPRVEQVEVNVTLLDKSRKVIARGSAFPSPPALETDAIGSFGTELRGAKVSPGDLLQFQVDYSVASGQSSFSWKSGFTVDATTGAVVGVGKKDEQSDW